MILMLLSRNTKENINTFTYNQHKLKIAKYIFAIKYADYIGIYFTLFCSLNKVTFNKGYIYFKMTIRT